VKSFLPFLLPKLWLCPERCFQNKSYINSLQSLVLPETKQKTHLGYRQLLPEGPTWESRNRDSKPVSSALGHFRDTLHPPAWGIQPAKILSLGKTYPSFLERRKWFHSSPASGRQI